MFTRTKELIYLLLIRIPLIIWGSMRRNLIHVHWGRGLHNFGDCLQPSILRHYGLTPVYASSLKKSDIILAGSILQSAPTDYNGIILGTGGDDYSYNFPFAKILAVRGKLTQGNIKQPKESIALGDTGLLMPFVFPNYSNKKFDIGIIPHFVDKNHPKLLSYIKKNKNMNVLVINVFDHPRKICKQITQCKYIFSSSLHGLILADAYNIPNLRFVIRETMPTYFYDYKYHDYYSSFGELNHDYVELKGNEFFHEIESRFISHYVNISHLMDQLNTLMIDVTASFQK